MPAGMGQTPDTFGPITNSYPNQDTGYGASGPPTGRGRGRKRRRRTPNQQQNINPPGAGGEDLVDPTTVVPHPLIGQGSRGPLIPFSGGGAGTAPTGGNPEQDWLNQRDRLINRLTPQNEIYNAYMRSFNQGGPLNVPSWQEQYGAYRDVAEQEAQRQSSAINEALGARGARYGSDILNAQGALRRNMQQNLQSAAGQYQMNARNQQFNEMNSVAAQQQAAWQQALAYLMQVHLGSTAPPPGSGVPPPTFAQPTTVLT